MSIAAYRATAARLKTTTRACPRPSFCNRAAYPGHHVIRWWPMKTLIICLALVMAAFAQSSPDDTNAQQPHSAKPKKPKKGAASEVGSGAGSIAGGTAKGAGHAAQGVGKGVADVATLHPVDGAAAIGTGAAKAGKDVTVGTVKGVGKIGKGVGHALGKIF